MSDITSFAEYDWARRKRGGATNSSIDAIMGLVGVQELKDHLPSLMNRADHLEEFAVKREKERFGMILTGSEGVGRATVARLYAETLVSLRLVPNNKVSEVQGAHQSARTSLQTAVEQAGVVILFNTQLFLQSNNASSQPRGNLDFLKNLLVTNANKCVFILIASSGEMVKQYLDSPELKTLGLLDIHIPDYSLGELQQIFAHRFKERYGPAMQVESGIKGPSIKALIETMMQRGAKSSPKHARGIEHLVQKLGLLRADRLVTAAGFGQELDTCLIAFIDMQRALVSSHDVDSAAGDSDSSGMTHATRSTAPSQPANSIRHRKFWMDYQKMLEETPSYGDREANVSDLVWQRLCEDREDETAKRLSRRENLCKLARVSKCREQSYNRAMAYAKTINASEKAQRTLRRRYKDMQLANQRLTDFSNEINQDNNQKKIVQAQVRRLASCPTYWDWKWIRQEDGYRCQGGGHFVGHDQLPVDTQGASANTVAGRTGTKGDAMKGDEKGKNVAEDVNEERAEKK